MAYLPYVVMIVAFIIMVVANNKAKEGVAWGKPVSILFALIALGCAGYKIYGNVGGGGGQGKVINIERQWQEVQGQFLGKYCAEQFSGKSALLIEAISSSSPDAAGDPLIDAFMKEIEGAITIAATVKPTIPEKLKQEYAGSEGDGGDIAEMVPIEEYYTAKELDKMVSANKTDLVITTIGLPGDFGKLLTKYKSGPQFILPQSSVYELESAIGRGIVVAALSYNPTKDYEAVKPPSNVDEAFAARYLLITPDNVKQMKTDYSSLFQ